MNTARRVRTAPLPDIKRLCVRQIQKYKKAAGYELPKGHGENIWVFAHRRTEQIIYSLQAHLNGFHSLKQLAFNGKKTKQPKLRKDYWDPMAKIEFPPGAGDVGHTVFQKLRELKHLHEVSWDDDVLFKAPLEYTADEAKAAERLRHMGRKLMAPRTKAQRGAALNAQKANAVADIAAVLGGCGRGNKVVIRVGEGDNVVTNLMNVVVRWRSEFDPGYAKSWTDNVSHLLLKETEPASKEARKEKASKEASEEKATKEAGKEKAGEEARMEKKEASSEA